MTKVRHILGISGGKDSAALSIYLKQKYPQLKIEYYNSDTGCELAETEVLIDRLSAYLGSIKRLRAAEGSPEPTPFEHFLKAMGGFLPSPQQRWCTKKMKLAEFERYAGEDYAVSYVGIRGDEDRDGYINIIPNRSNVEDFKITLNDNIIVYFNGNGGDSVLGFPNNDLLYSNVFIDALINFDQEQKIAGNKDGLN